jgi:hypothetical protein
VRSYCLCKHGDVIDCYNISLCQAEYIRIYKNTFLTGYSLDSDSVDNERTTKKNDSKE